MFYCLMNSAGKPISQTVAGELLKGARLMVRDAAKRHKIKSKHCSGFIYTQYKHSAMGTLSGIEFTAEIVVPQGETKVTYLVRNFDLDEDGEWVPYRSVRELEEVIAQAEVSQHAEVGRKLN